MTAPALMSYVPRRMVPGEIWPVRSTPPGARPRRACRSASWPRVRRSAVLHEASQGVWLLMHRWAHGDICCGRLSRADAGHATFAPIDHRPLVACDLKTRLIEHERQAWMDAMPTDAPSLEIYLADTLAPGDF